jgi:hypothetical protein
MDVDRPNSVAVAGFSERLVKNGIHLVANGL